MLHSERAVIGNPLRQIVRLASHRCDDGDPRLPAGKRDHADTAGKRRAIGGIENFHPGTGGVLARYVETPARSAGLELECSLRMSERRSSIVIDNFGIVPSVVETQPLAPRESTCSKYPEIIYLKYWRLNSGHIERGTEIVKSWTRAMSERFPLPIRGKREETTAITASRCASSCSRSRRRRRRRVWCP